MQSRSTSTSAAEAANVIGKAKGLRWQILQKVLTSMPLSKWPATLPSLVPQASSSSADASTTNGGATATNTSSVITGADLSQGLVDIGGIGTIAGQANFDLSASSTNVSGESTAKVVSADATGLVGGITDVEGTFGIDVASDSNLSGVSIGSLTTDASSTTGSADAFCWIAKYVRCWC